MMKKILLTICMVALGAAANEPDPNAAMKEELRKQQEAYLKCSLGDEAYKKYIETTKDAARKRAERKKEKLRKKAIDPEYEARKRRFAEREYERIRSTSRNRKKIKKAAKRCAKLGGWPFN